MRNHSDDNDANNPNYLRFYNREPLLRKDWEIVQN